MSNRRNTKSSLLVLAVVLVVIAMLLFIWQLVKPTDDVGSKTVYVAVNHTDGKERRYTFRTDYEFLSQLLLDEGLIDGYEDDNGYTVATFNGEFVDHTSGQRWVFTRNGEQVSTDVSTTPIDDGDVFKFSVYTP